MSILVTGGAGFIGSHTCVELLNAGYHVVVVDNLCNSSRESIARIEQITSQKITFYENDLLDKEALNVIFRKEDITAVIHFAALKAVGESVAKPLEYYSNNLTGTLMLCEVMQKYGVKNMIFSSSATVYGRPVSVPIKEDFPLKVKSPYGRTKLMTEEILRDLYTGDHEWNIVLLRYFNPIGAHKSGLLGENPKGIPKNLIPYIMQVASGKLDYVRVFGNDYNTKDGTGVRDYIHVVDLAVGHVKALDKLKENQGVATYNLGTGVGYSVFEVIDSFEKVCEKKIPYQIVPRRPGDIGQCYADSTLAREELGWEAQKGLQEMCEDAWRWQRQNPDGYQKY